MDSRDEEVRSVQQSIASSVQYVTKIAKQEEERKNNASALSIESGKPRSDQVNKIIGKEKESEILASGEDYSDDYDMDPDQEEPIKDGVKSDIEVDLK